MKITKSQLKKIIKEALNEAIEIGGESLSFSRPPEPAKEILKQVAQRLSEIQDIDAITEDQAMDVLDLVIDSMQEIFHLGGFGTESPVEEKKDNRVSKKISHLQSKEGVPHKQAVAMAINMDKEGRLTKGGKYKKKRGKK